MMKRKMRCIEDLRDDHKDEEILVIGRGSSLDDFPEKFFKDKITIALNWAILRFPDCTYWHGHHEDVREYLRDEKPEFLDKSIISFPFPGPFLHGRITDREEFFGDAVSKPIWMRFGDIRPIPKSAFEEVVECIMEKRNDCQYRASGTVAHTAVEAAAVMGAKRITMIGCEHRGFYAKRYGMESYRPSRVLPDNYASKFEDGTRWLAELLQPHGIEVRRYFYDSGYEPIIKENKLVNSQKRLTRWTEAQTWELGWWGDCQNTYNEETKQLLYANKIGLTRVPDNKTPFRFDMEGKSVLDIGGGPVSLLLKCDNVKGKVVDPLKFPKWVEERYKVAGIEYERMKAEGVKARDKFDETWCYNVLEHVEDPYQVVKRMRKVGKIIRIFEWLETRVNIGHPHSLTEEKLNHWLGGEGKVEEIKGQNSCWGKAFYGIFKGDNFEE